MHVLQIIANNSSVPYFNWFADRIGQYPGMKFSFVALYHEKPAMIDEMKKKGNDCYWIKFDHRHRKKSMITSFFKLYKLFRHLKPDVVNTHLFDDSLPALFAAKLAGVKMRVITKNDTAFHWMYSPQWVKADRFNNINATHIVAISGEAKKFIIEKEKADIDKICLIHHSISISDSTHQTAQDKAELKKRFGLENKMVIGTVARYIDWKGYRYIIEAARTIKEKHKDVKFLFAGHGEQKTELQELVKKHGLGEYIVFTGWIKKEQMPSLYGVMDIFLHAAIMEPFGFVFAEAMANGVPIVTTPTGVAGDVLKDRETCYFVKYKDAQGIAEGIEWMLEHPAERAVMKEKIKEIAKEQLSVEKMLDDYIRLYKGELRP